MKTLFFVFFLCMLISCGEKVLDKPAPPPPWVPKEFTVEVVGDYLTVIPAVKSKVIEGKRLDLVITVLPGRVLESATVNGITIPVSGTVLTYPISNPRNNYLLNVVTKPEPPKEFTIEVMGDYLTVLPAVKSKITEGTGLTLVINAMPGRMLESATVNGITIPVSGTILTYPISDINKDYLINVVTKLIPTRTDTLSGIGWGLVEIKYIYENKWYFVNLTDSEKTDRRIFKTDFTYTLFDKEGKKDGAGSWTWIASDSIKIGGVRYKYTLSEKVFTRSERGGTILDRFER